VDPSPCRRGEAGREGVVFACEGDDQHAIGIAGLNVGVLGILVARGFTLALVGAADKSSQSVSMLGFWDS
jgi:hypothetical protein